jgi:Ca2+-binding EF-hand superfamily protein
MKISSILVALLASVSLAVAADEAKPKAPKPKADPAAAFAKMDKDGDGKLSKDEFLATAKDDAAKAKKEQQFTAKDKDKDGFVSKDEFLAKPEKKKGK